jgi:hypothetical protein
MTKSEILDSFLLPLADAFEAGRNAGYSITDANAEEYEPLRECLAEEIADGSLTDPRRMKIYHLTKAGYAKHKPRIEALRALPR